MSDAEKKAQECTAGIDFDTTAGRYTVEERIAQALTAAHDEALERVVKALNGQAENYHSQMEGKGEPEFTSLQFAMQACDYMAQYFRKLKKKP